MFFAMIWQTATTAVPGWLAVAAVSVTIGVGITTVLTLTLSRVWQRAWDQSKVVLSLDTLTSEVRELRQDFKKVIALDKEVALILQRMDDVEERMPVR